ncbi:unnamed protein product [Gordionus sp. m RMFG-2023]
MKIQTVAENIDNLLKLRKLKIKKTIKNKDYIEYLGYQYLLHKSETCKPIQNALPLSTNIILEQLSSNFQDDSQKAGHSQEQSLTLPNQGDTQNAPNISNDFYTSPLNSEIESDYYLENMHIFVESTFVS